MDVLFNAPELVCWRKLAEHYYCKVVLLRGRKKPGQMGKYFQSLIVFADIRIGPYRSDSAEETIIISTW